MNSPHALIPFIFNNLFRNKTLPASLLLLLLVITSLPVYSEALVFTAAPRESAAQGKKLYGPLTEFISKTLGKEVKYVNAGSWLRYQSHIKKLKYDFVLDGPHLASWRIKNIDHKPLIKLPGNLQFYILARANDKKTTKPEDLIYKRVCVIPPPNLTAMVLLRRLSDPVREPFVVGVKGGMKKLVSELINNKCNGTVVRADFYNNKLSAEMKSKVKIIYTSDELPNQVITASADIRLALSSSVIRLEAVIT